MTTIMQIYLTILISIFLIMVLTGAIASIFSGSYYYEKVSDVFYTIFKISFFAIIVWGFYIGIACIWHLY